MPRRALADRSRFGAAFPPLAVIHPGTLRGTLPDAGGRDVRPPGGLRPLAMRRVAVVGSGISGLSVARGLAGLAHVTLFEAGSYFGG